MVRSVMHRRSLYKYFSERKWAERFLDGEILFRSLAYFRDYEDGNIRRIETRERRYSGRRMASSSIMSLREQHLLFRTAHSSQRRSKRKYLYSA